MCCCATCLFIFDILCEQDVPLQFNLLLLQGPCNCCSDICAMLRSILTRGGSGSNLWCWLWSEGDQQLAVLPVRRTYPIQVSFTVQQCEITSIPKILQIMGTKLISNLMRPLLRAHTCLPYSPEPCAWRVRKHRMLGANRDLESRTYMLLWPEDVLIVQTDKSLCAGQVISCHRHHIVHVVGLGLLSSS